MMSNIVMGSGCPSDRLMQGVARVGASGERLGVQGARDLAPSRKVALGRWLSERFVDGASAGMQMR